MKEVLTQTMMIILANLVPTVEQIGGIPLGIALGLNPFYVYLVSVLVNSLLFFPLYVFLELFYDNLLSRWRWFRRYLERTRKKGKPYVDRYGVLGVTLFISLPGPFTGTYTATILSWLLGLEKKKAFLAICLGSSIGGLLILASAMGLLKTLTLFKL